MCGILAGFGPGIIDSKHKGLYEALYSLKHRGPDNISHFSDEQIFLGHTRLSIIDTGVLANQPFIYEDLVMIYNGEVFNYIELRQILQKDGYSFESQSDTEVVIKAFHRYGEECFKLFNGMWALAIYDLKQKDLVICRDRYGQKPLFITQFQNDFYIASELQALSSIVPVKPNFGAIESFLKEADFNVKWNTFFENIFEFPSAVFLRISQQGEVSFNTYWSYPGYVTTPETSTTEFHQLLEDAVALRLRSDVNYSLLLSGGCDSTLISGITRKLIGENATLSAFNYASRDDYDESKFAQEVANRLNIKLYHSEQDKNPESFIYRLQRLVRHLGRGHGSPAIISVDYLYESLGKKGFKVTLDGQGADELLAGYTHYHFHLLLDQIRYNQWGQFWITIKDIGKVGLVKILLYALRLSLSPGLKKIMRIVYGYERLFTKNSNHKLQTPLLNIKSKKPNKQEYLNKYLINQHQNGLKNLLYYGDIVAMANSVENRSPFMDHRLVEAAFKASFRLKVENGRNKAVLKKHPVFIAFKDILEREKVGFASFIAQPIKEMFVSELKTSPILNWPIFREGELKSFLKNQRLAQSTKYEPLLFRFFQVHLWAKEYLITDLPDAAKF